MYSVSYESILFKTEQRIYRALFFLNLEKSKHGPEAGVCLFSWAPMEAVSKILLICLWAKYV